ncbi:hypothetical protein GGU10DRAFT_381060 [Lentinula aff. detonsa]|uniref:DUF4939 domain-containing protein n=1 Tax=Lentinula aff. detonsa TaxID=2804958 RepID=A0AA38KBH9_9AGAR|nr:hypothetical protein GGU10DRAFT_381060 [Lentinula aff. detonsa]
MAYCTHACACSNTNVSDTSVHDEQEANPFATTAASFLPFSESISAIGTSRHCRSTAYGPSAPSAATATLSAIGEITSPDLAVETLYTKDGLPVEGPEPTEQVQDKEPDVPANENQPEDPTPQGPGGGPGRPDGPGGPGGPGNSGNSGDDEVPIPDSSQFMNIMSNFSSNINNLGIVLSGMKSTDDAGNKTKPREAEVFDGSDLRKLQSFLVSLALVFNDRPKYFTETKKINYTLSYLSGTARQWFEPDILDPDLLNMPEWTYLFSTLVRELQKQFGVYDMQSKAECKIGNIVMKDLDTI